jgi:S-adenosylmethionine-diacylglycerol 3-amino-3-carboxypropyl transferase
MIARAQLTEPVPPATAGDGPEADADTARPRPQILTRPVFGRLLFAQCWEDPALNVEALRPRPGQTLLSVTSGGCNTLSLALAGYDRVLAVDLNPVQSALLELKIAGARALSHAEYLEFLGVRPSAQRPALYQAARAELSPAVRDYWDARPEPIRAGILLAGRYERYLGAFRRLLGVLVGRRRVARLFELESPADQRHFYDTEWDTRRWRLFFRLFFSRTALGLGGLDRAFFTYVEGIPDFGAHFLARARHVLVDLPVRDNYFLAQICLGRYRDERALPPYLREENFAALRAATRRIEVLTDEVGAVLARLPEASVDAFNFSNCFEWVPPATFEAMLRETYRVARPGARLCYWNLLVRRRHPRTLDALFAPEDDLAARLLWQDRAFVYSHFEVAGVRKAAPWPSAAAPPAAPPGGPARPA